MAKHPVKALPYANDALKGIGAKTLEKLRPFVTVGTKNRTA